MHSFFSPDGPFNTFMTLLFDLVVLNVLWIVCCLPIITIGASTTALYTVMLKRARNEEGYVIRGFFAAFKSNFRQSVPVTLILIAITAVLSCDFLIVRQWDSSMGSIMLGLCYVAGIFAAAIFCYVWPLMAKFENSIGNMFNNAWRLAIANLPQTIAMVVINYLPLILFVFFTQIFIYVFVFWLLIGFSVAAYWSSKLLNPIFDRYTT